MTRAEFVRLQAAKTVLERQGRIPRIFVPWPTDDVADDEIPADCDPDDVRLANRIQRRLAALPGYAEWSSWDDRYPRPCEPFAQPLPGDAS